MKSIISLWGMMGVGKTHWGKVLAKRYQMSHLDLDEYIVSASGISIPHWFEEQGELKFRAFEKDCIRSILETYRNQPLVLSLGGGTPCFPPLDDWLFQKTLSIFLYEEAKVLQDRLLASTQIRPLLKGKEGVALLESLLELERERKPFYDRAQFKVKSDTNALSKLCKIVEPFLSNQD
jgi:shikimate kinase